MASTSYEIDSYEIYHYTENSPYSAAINCKGSGSVKGTLYFYKEGATIPDNSKTDSGKLYIRFRDNQLNNILSTLRQEKPLYIWLDTTFLIGGLKTSSASFEPVGEEES